MLVFFISMVAGLRRIRVGIFGISLPWSINSPVIFFIGGIFNSVTSVGCFAVDREFTYNFFGSGQMEANGYVQQLDLAEIFTISILQLKCDVKSASRLRMYISTEEMNIFKMRRAGPLSTWVQGPARHMLKMFI